METIALNPSSVEINTTADGWQVYRHIEFENHSGLNESIRGLDVTMTLCGRAHWQYTKPSGILMNLQIAQIAVLLFALHEKAA